MKYSILYTIFLFAFLISCKSKVDFDVKEFNPYINLTKHSDTTDLSIDLSEAVLDGISIPSKAQCASGFFILSFEIINKSDKPKAFYYKIFYQNESYKFNEYILIGGNIEYNKLSANNFYGSWENSIDSFHVTSVIPNDNNYHVVTDSFRIIGNPRDEEKYFGVATSNPRISKELLNETILVIRNDAEWFDKIKEKAKTNNITIDEQLYKDAMWVINDNLQYGNINNRWKRNPRVGDYSFLLALTSECNYGNISGTIKSIGKTKDDNFINPYYELLYNNKLLEKEPLTVIKAKYVLRTKTKFNLGSGIYINETKFIEKKIDSSFYSKNCGSSNNIFKYAQFEQYFHNINKNIILSNIPLAYDVVGDNYTQVDYKNNKVKYLSDNLLSDCFKITDFPGRTVSSIPEKIC